MFYSDYGVRVYQTRASNYILRFAAHFDQYLNARFVRSIGYDEICWC
jgi:hypothetical protein